MTEISIEKQIYLAVAYRETNLAVIARKLKMTRQNLYSKIARNTLKKEELCKIGKILGGKYVSYFAFPGGVKIGKAKARRKTAASRQDDSETR